MDGDPATGYQFQAALESSRGRQVLPVKTEENRFQFWVPVGMTGWFRLHLQATSADGGRVARETILSYELHQAAVEGVKLTMKPGERSVSVSVTADGTPVSGATVAAELSAGLRLEAKTNDDGVATLSLMNHDKLTQLTAWTDDFKIGGYSFYRDPPRNPLANQHTIELDTCRPQRIRLINEADQSPVPNVEFLLTVGTGAPNYQFPGKTPTCRMKTDSKGEAVYRWFPDWERHGSYVSLNDRRWVKAADPQTVDGTMVIPLKKSRFQDRKRVVGRVKAADGNVAGFFLRIDSFQGEEEHSMDALYAFTDENGRFAADCLPGATYCVYVNDARFVSELIDLILVDPLNERINSPELTVVKGQPVEIVVTSGPDKVPLPYQGINLRTEHDYTWLEDGKKRHGTNSRQWWVTTDRSGRVHTYALPGKEVHASLYSPEWRSKQTALVKPEGVTKVEFHQQIAEKRRINGRLRLAKNVEADLNEAVVEIGAIDGETKERLTVTTNPRGDFEFESKATRIGIYARTRNAKAAAVLIVDRLEEPIAVTLNATGEFHGQLLGEQNRPLAGHSVRAELRVSGERDYSKPFSTSFAAATFETKTDSDGNYSLNGLPRETVMRLVAASLDGAGGDRYLDEFYLTPGESRPRAVSRLWSPERKVTFHERYERTVRDCRLSHFHPLVILFRPSEDTEQFINTNLMSGAKTKEIYTFMQLKLPLEEDPEDSEIAQFVQSRNWPAPDQGQVFVCALGDTGEELGRIVLDATDSDSAQVAAEFIRKHATPQLDAKKKWDKAFAAAKRTGRKVWVRISQRYCGPCFRLTRWLDDQKQLLEKDYVFLKIDDVRDLHGREVAERLTAGENFGVPFHAIFDADGKMLITSESVLGNIGSPSGYEGKKHLRKMLTETRGQLSDKQVDEILSSLDD